MPVAATGALELYTPAMLLQRLACKLCSEVYTQYHQVHR